VDKKNISVDKTYLFEQLKEVERNFIHFFNKPIRINKNKVEIVFKDEEEVLAFIQHFQQLYDED
jgi:tRNA uridine 5-carbamoylmethylation protein Kti12